MLQRCKPDAHGAGRGNAGDDTAEAGRGEAALHRTEERARVLAVRDLLERGQNRLAERIDPLAGGGGAGKDRRPLE